MWRGSQTRKASFEPIDIATASVNLLKNELGFGLGRQFPGFFLEKFFQIQAETGHGMPGPVAAAAQQTRQTPGKLIAGVTGQSGFQIDVQFLKQPLQLMG